MKKEAIIKGLKEFLEEIKNNNSGIIKAFIDYYGEERISIVMDYFDVDRFINNIWSSTKLHKLNYHLYYFDSLISNECSKLDCPIKEKYPTIGEFLESQDLDSVLRCFKENVSTWYIYNCELENNYKEGNDVRSIIVYFPNVHISNEYGESHIIHDLYARINLKESGGIRKSIWYKRGTLTTSELIAGYKHSHVSTFGNHSSHTEWYLVCLGSGPIREIMDNIGSLNSFLVLEEEDKNAKDTIQEDYYNTATMFCMELERLVSVESVEGGPYVRIRKVRAIKDNYEFVPIRLDVHNKIRSMIGIDTEIFLKNNFFPVLMESGILKFGYRNNTFVLGESLTETMIKVNNLFVEWFNAWYNAKTENPNSVDDTIRNLERRILYSRGVLKSVVIDDGIIKEKNSNRRAGNNDYDRVKDNFINKPILEFKGYTVLGKEIVENEESPSITTVDMLNPSIINILINNIIDLLNLKYNDKAYNNTKISNNQGTNSSSNSHNPCDRFQVFF